MWFGWEYSYFILACSGFYSALLDLPASTCQLVPLWTAGDFETIDVAMLERVRGGQAGQWLVSPISYLRTLVYKHSCVLRGLN